MNNMFADMIDVTVIIYLDDILIYSGNMSEHKAQVQEVLRRLRAKRLFVQANKCEFHITSCEYLRYMLSPEGLTMAPYKVQIIQDWPEPRKVKDIQSFLGFANFYQHFIYGYSEITIPLMCLTRKGTIWNFTDECRSAFEALKRLLPQRQSSTIGFQTSRSQLKLMPLTTHSLQYCQSQPRLANCTPLHSIPKPSQLQNSTTMCMTKSYSQFLKPSNDGSIISKALHSRSMWSPITRTCNIFP